MDRNLFGGVERRRFDLEGGLAPFGGTSTFRSFSSLRFDDVIGRVGASFVKPALWGTRNDLLVDVAGVRERTDYYCATYGAATVAIRHRVSDTASIQGGVEIKGGHTFDAWGGHDYSLLGFPISETYDCTDNALAPTRGIRAVARVTPYVKALPWRRHGAVQSADFRLFRHRRRRLVHSRGPRRRRLHRRRQHRRHPRQPSLLRRRRRLGARLSLSLAQSRQWLRFSDRRTQPFRSLGRGAHQGHAKNRHRAFRRRRPGLSAPYPDFRTTMRASAGLSLRYYTGIGPIRFDVATPLNPRHGESKFAIFIGMGESF